MNGISPKLKSANVGYASNACPITAPAVPLDVTSYASVLRKLLTFITLVGNNG